MQAFVYLAVVLDAFSRRVVGWALDDSLHAPLAIAALTKAIAQRKLAPIGPRKSEDSITKRLKEPHKRRVMLREAFRPLKPEDSPRKGKSDASTRASVFVSPEQHG